MGLDEKVAATLTFQHAYDLPGILLMAFGVGTDDGDVFVAQMTGRPHGTVLRVDEIGATTRVRDLADLDHGRQLVGLRIHHRDLVRLVSGREKVALRRVPAAVVQEARGVDAGHLEVVHVLVVDQQDLAGFLDVDDELRMLVRGDDRGDARLGMVLLRIDRHAARGDDLERL